MKCKLFLLGDSVGVPGPHSCGDLDRACIYPPLGGQTSAELGWGDCSMCWRANVIDWGSSSDLNARVGSSRVKSQAVDCTCVHLCPVVGIPWCVCGGGVLDEE